MLNGIFFAALAAYFAATLLQFAAAAFKKKALEQGAWVLCLLAFALNSAYLGAGALSPDDYRCPTSLSSPQLSPGASR